MRLSGSGAAGSRATTRSPRRGRSVSCGPRLAARSVSSWASHKQQSRTPAWTALPRSSSTRAGRLRTSPISCRAAGRPRSVLAERDLESPSDSHPAGSAVATSRRPHESTNPPHHSERLNTVPTINDPDIRAAESAMKLAEDVNQQDRAPHIEEAQAYALISIAKGLDAITRYGIEVTQSDGTL